MATFKSLTALEKALQKKIDKALQTDVADTVKQVEQDVIGEVVYDAYSPMMYRRRGDTAGLASLDNIEAELVAPGTLVVTSETPPNPNYPSKIPSQGSIAEAVEHGHSYTFFNPGPRPFTAKTVERLEKTGEHVEAMRDGLRRQGLDVK